jgi:transcriptional regulator with XRE-family HTH domain
VSIAERFGENLTRFREATGLSQEEVGIRASLHRTEVSQLERAQRVPRIDTVVKLAGALGVKAGDLLGGITWTPATVQPGRFEAPGGTDAPGSLKP